MKTLPKVSVILSTHNGQNYLKKSVESVLLQKYHNIELIIVNDASTDQTEEIILNFKKNDSRVIYLKNHTNLKLIKSLNLGLKAASGKYIARIDQDDIWEDRNKLKKQIKILEDNKEVGLVGTNSKIINEKEEIIKKTNNKLNDIEIRNNLLLNNQFIHSTVVFRASIKGKKIFYQDKKANYLVEDYELWMRIGKTHSLINIDDYSVLYRRNESGSSFNGFYLQKINGLFLVLKYKNYYPNFLLALFMRLSRLMIPRKMSYFLQNKYIL